VLECNGVPRNGFQQICSSSIGPGVATANWTTKINGLREIGFVSPEKKRTTHHPMQPFATFCNPFRDFWTGTKKLDRRAARPTLSNTFQHFQHANLPPTRQAGVPTCLTAL
jgi:hypothetical protein